MGFIKRIMIANKKARDIKKGEYIYMMNITEDLFLETWEVMQLNQVLNE